jgi:sensor c-di-GMP phosphodiesterase-like protein
VRKITDDAEDAAVVRSLIAMAHNLGLAVIAEGVETDAQAAFLLDEQCEEAQGFLYAKPLPADEFAGYLGTRRLAAQEKLSLDPRRTADGRVERSGAKTSGRRTASKA